MVGLGFDTPLSAPCQALNVFSPPPYTQSPQGHLAPGRCFLEWGQGQGEGVHIAYLILQAALQ